MNRMFKVGIAALALAAVSPAFALDNLEVEEEGAVGWTPVAFGLASPVQLPWGHANWDVFGLGLNALYTGEAKMYGLGIGGLGMYTADDMIGLGISGLMNLNAKDVVGLNVTLGANICQGTVYGMQAGAFGYGKDIWGLDVEFLGGMYDNFWGVQIGGLANIVKQQSYGWNVAIGVNIADVAYGWQLAGIFNMAQELHGCQLGVVNFADNCEWGFQIGIVNIIMSNKLKVLPIVNAYF